MYRLFSFLGSFAVAAAFCSFGMQGSFAQAADDCATVRSQIFGTGPNDMQSAAYKYRNYKVALAKTQYRLRQDEDTLEVSRTASAAYFLKYGKTDPLLEFHLSTATNRVREDRNNVRYFTGKLAAAASALSRLNAEYKRLGCGATGDSTSENWAGTYVDASAHKLEISGSGATFTAESTWSPSEAQGGSATLNCTANGSTATCHGTGKYFDSEKTITTTLETTLSKSGSTIRETDKVLTASCKPEKEGVSDCKDLGYTPAVHAGAEFTTTMRKE